MKITYGESFLLCEPLPVTRDEYVNYLLEYRNNLIMGGVPFARETVPIITGLMEKISSLKEEEYKKLREYNKKGKIIAGSYEQKLDL